VIELGIAGVTIPGKFAIVLIVSVETPLAMEHIIMAGGDAASSQYSRKILITINRKTV
jgi:hypothetical protein